MTSSPTIDALTELRGDLVSAWAAAAEVEAHTLDLEMAGLSVRVQIAGNRLLEIMEPALEVHRRLSVVRPDVLVRAFDAAATGAPMPRVARRRAGQVVHWKPTPRAPGGIRWTWHDESATGLFHDPNDIGTLAAVTDARGLPWYEHGAPLRQALAWAMAPYQRHFVHCAAVGTRDGAVLLVGPSGAGKTSTAVSALLAGMHFLGDDYCVLTLEGGPIVHTLYGTLKLFPEQLALVDPQDALGDHLIHEGVDRSPSGVDGSKSIAVASRWAPHQIVASAPVRAVIVPSVDPPHGLSELTAVAALRQLAPTSVLQLSGAGADDLAALAALVRQVPCHRFGLLPDRAANPPVLATLLERMRP